VPISSSAFRLLIVDSVRFMKRGREDGPGATCGLRRKTRGTVRRADWTPVRREITRYTLEMSLQTIETEKLLTFCRFLISAETHPLLREAPDYDWENGLQFAFILIDTRKSRVSISTRGPIGWSKRFRLAHNITTNLVA
jgi:hypothetical protein